MIGRLTTILLAEPADLPRVFLLPGRKPLKRQIFTDLVDRYPAANKDDLRQRLKWRSRNPGYLDAMIDGASRHDLDGNVVDAVEAAHAKFAQSLKRPRAARPAPPPVRVSTRPILSLPGAVKPGIIIHNQSKHRNSK
jgi:sRNA-binding protein